MYSSAPYRSTNSGLNAKENSTLPFRATGNRIWRGVGLWDGGVVCGREHRGAANSGQQRTSWGIDLHRL